MKKRPVQVYVRLMQAQLETLGAFDYVVMGHKNPLKTVLENQGHQFHGQWTGVIEPRPWMLSMHETHDWPAVALINTRLQEPYRESVPSRLTEALKYALAKRKAQRIALLPLSWRKPDLVAQHTLYALWLIGYAASVQSPLAGYAHLQGTEFFIVSQDDVSPYRRHLESRLVAFETFIEQLRCRSRSPEWVPTLQELRRIPVQIIWRQGSEPPQVVSPFRSK